MTAFEIKGGITTEVWDKVIAAVTVFENKVGMGGQVLECVMYSCGRSIRSESCGAVADLWRCNRSVVL